MTGSKTPRILIVDDSPLVLEVARAALIAEGYAVDIAIDLGQVEREGLPRHPDLILMDVEMPEAFGDDLAMLMKSSRGVEVPILLYSTLDEAELAERAADAEIDGFISKCAGIAALVDRVRETLPPPPAARTPHDDLRDRLMPRFVATARERLQRVDTALVQQTASMRSVVAGELHALAGEAIVMGQLELGAVTRMAEMCAKDGSTAQPRIAQLVRVVVQRMDGLTEGLGLEPVAVKRRCVALTGADRSELVDALARIGIDLAVAENLDDALRLVRSLRPAVVLAEAHRSDVDLLRSRLAEVTAGWPPVLLELGRQSEPSARGHADGLVDLDRGMDEAAQQIAARL